MDRQLCDVAILGFPGIETHLPKPKLYSHPPNPQSEKPQTVFSRHHVVGGLPRSLPQAGCLRQALSVGHVFLFLFSPGYFSPLKSCQRSVRANPGLLPAGTAGRHPFPPPRRTSGDLDGVGGKEAGGQWPGSSLPERRARFDLGFISSGVWFCLEVGIDVNPLEGLHRVGFGLITYQAPQTDCWWLPGARC